MDKPSSIESIVYDLASAEEFWDELDAILTLPERPNLVQLDNTLRLFIALLSQYHDQFLHTISEYHHAFSALGQSDLFRYHSERMCNLAITEAENSTNPHTLYVIYNILLIHGTKYHHVFKSHKRWRKLLACLCDVIILEVDDGVLDDGQQAIEARLRLPAASLMYEVCRAQKLDSMELDEFDDDFIDKLFDLVETTRDQQDETLNYAAIKVLVALNEQFMVSAASSLSAAEAQISGSSSSNVPFRSPRTSKERSNTHPAHDRQHYRTLSNSHPTLQPTQLYNVRGPNGQQASAQKDGEEQKTNRVLTVLMRRLGDSKTFGENIIFMLNRAEDTAEDRCMRLLILKILYLLFTTPGTFQYFYTNDLQVLVDVIIRELVDIGEDNEALRHTFLRVLNPLLTNTQLRQRPYKHAQIRLILLSLISNNHIKEVNPTTKRLVERCLNADWCEKADTVPEINSGIAIEKPKSKPLIRRLSTKLLGRSQSVEDMPKLHKAHLTIPEEQRPNNSSMISLAVAPSNSPPLHRKANRTLSNSTSNSDSDGSTQPSSSLPRPVPYLQRTASGIEAERAWIGFSTAETVIGDLQALSIDTGPLQAPSSPSGSNSGFKRRAPPAVPDRSKKPPKRASESVATGSPASQPHALWHETAVDPHLNKYGDLANDPTDLHAHGPSPAPGMRPGMKHARQVSAFGSANLGFAALAHALNISNLHTTHLPGRQPGKRPETQRHLPHNPIMSPLPAHEKQVDPMSQVSVGGNLPGGYFRKAQGWETFAA